MARQFGSPSKIHAMAGRRHAGMALRVAQGAHVYAATGQCPLAMQAVLDTMRFVGMANESFASTKSSKGYRKAQKKIARAEQISQRVVGRCVLGMTPRAGDWNVATDAEINKLLQKIR